ncbi:DUF3472 domain-containing protein [Pseudomonas sp. FYR_11]|uniref:DUF3472 domain-containing protein n=1 Tax=Pseudomonas TaxID=286 RepID=UPI00370B5050
MNVLGKAIKVFSAVFMRLLGKAVRGFPTSGPTLKPYFEAVTVADGVYAEFYVPAGGNKPYIYWSSLNFQFGGRGGYTGIQHGYSPRTRTHTYGNICSFWSSASDELNEGVAVVHGIRCLLVDGFGGEGTGLHTSYPDMNWRQDTWYASFIRRWEDPRKGLTYVAMFIYDSKAAKWTHYLTVSLPGTGASTVLDTRSLHGFLENFYPLGENGKPEGYSGIYRDYFALSAGSTAWVKPESYTVSAGGPASYWMAEAVQDNTAIQVTAGGVFDNESGSLTFQLRQGDRPSTVSRPAITKIGFIEWVEGSNVITFIWTIDEYSAPQLKIEGYLSDREGNKLGPVVSVCNPALRRGFLKLYEVPEKWSYVTINFQITSIFNEASEVFQKEYRVGTIGN